jgi:hypothetical protein
LNWAVAKERPDVVEVLLSTSASLETTKDQVAKDDYLKKLTMIAEAAQNGDLKTVQLLSEHYPFSLSCGPIDQAVSVALLNKRIDIADCLIKRSNELECSSLLAVKLAKNGNLDKSVARTIYEHRSPQAAMEDSGAFERFWRAAKEHPASSK